MKRSLFAFAVIVVLIGGSAPIGAATDRPAAVAPTTAVGAAAASATATPGATTWFFSEGNTLPGWFEFITIVNPDAAVELSVTIEYALEVVPGVADAPRTTVILVPAGQRRTIPVFDATAGGVGRDAPAPRGPGGGYTGVAAKLTGLRPFVAERPMYFVNGFDIGAVNGAHDALGVTAESTLWYFGEGSTLPGFQPFFTLQNVRDVTSSVTITYATEVPDGSQVRTLSLPPKSRTTVDIRNAGPGGLGSEVQGFGTTIQASSPIVAERPIYVNRDLGGIGAINGATDEHGAAALSPVWTFAEGTMLPNFFEFLTLFNPSSLAANLEVTYQLDGGSPVVKSLTLPAGRRQTIQVYNDQSPGGLGRTPALTANPISGGVAVGIRAVNGTPFLAERPMYVANQDFGTGPINGAHDVLGHPGLGAPTWTFAEGSVRPGLFEFLTLQNPSVTPTAVQIDYLVSGGPTQSRSLTLPASSRTTVTVFGSPSQGGYGPPSDAATADIGARVSAVDGVSPIVAERPIYVLRAFEGTVINDAHDTLGFPSGVTDRRLDGPEVTVLSSDTSQLSLHVEFPDPEFYPVSGGGQNFTGVSMPGMGNVPTTPGAGEPDQLGKPGVPQFTTAFGVPVGGGVAMDVLGSDSYDLKGLYLAPGQDQASDAQRPHPPFDENYVPPFEFDPAAYQTDAPFPASPATAGMGGQLRDLQTGGLMLVGAQYRALSRTLTVFRSIDVRIKFGANSGIFGPGEVGDEWNLPYRRIYAAFLVNWDLILSKLGPVVRPAPCGEEFMIFTPNELTPAADALVAARNAEGIVTRRFLVGPGGTPGDYPSIKNVIMNEFGTTECKIHPSYVLFMGDINFISSTINVLPWATDIGSDLPYALLAGADNLPDVALGRIPAQTLTDAMTVVNKILAYQTAPPVKNDFYFHTFNASYFQGSDSQDDRPYVRTSETIRNALTLLGYQVDRIYTLDGPTVNPLTDDIGAAYPGAILRSNGFLWDGGPDDITPALNAGRFLAFQRDHGYNDGWSAPNLDVSHLLQLTVTDNEYTVAFSIDCSSGYYDDPSGNQHHAEKFLGRAGGGAVGVVAASRVSPTYDNNFLALGMYDAMFPSTLPTYGMTDTAIRRLGDVMNYGKVYVSSAVSPNSSDLPLYQYFGDPTMQIWVGPPSKFDPSKFKVVLVGSKVVIDWIGPDPPPEETVLTVRGGRGGPARALLIGGHAEITTSTTTFKGVTLSFQRDGFVSNSEPLG